MSKVVICMADGCEEIEGLTVVDILRRAAVEIDMVSIMDTLDITGAHGIVFKADKMFSDANWDEYDGIILPGGGVGTNNLMAHEGLAAILKEFAAKGKLVSAICAAPSVLGQLELLKGKKATCYPGFESKLIGATSVAEPSVVDGNVITGKGMGTAIDFALDIVAYLIDEAKADELAKQIMYR